MQGGWGAERRRASHAAPGVCVSKQGLRVQLHSSFHSELSL